MRVAVVGAGVAGLGAAWRLSASHEVTLFEARDRAGGHANTVDVTLDGVRHPVDTGFLVFNERTYPALLGLFAELGVAAAPTDMSFSVSIGRGGPEWCGSSLATLFAQPGNVVSPRFWSMLADIARFNRQASALAGAEGRVPALEQPLERFLAENGYGAAFRDWYLLPMAAAIWSCPVATMRSFPLGTFVRFFHNHGLLQVGNRPQWYTVPGGSRRYVARIVAALDDVRLATPVRAIVRCPAGTRPRVSVHTDAGSEQFDAVVLATHSDQSLALLSDANGDERRLLAAIPYQRNRAVLHTDATLMPQRRRAWAAWNYLSDGGAQDPAVSVTYWLNRLQPLPFSTPLFVSLNPLREPGPTSVIATFDYEHPVFDAGAPKAQADLGARQGAGGVWFAGAWTGYGFHEDGLRAGFAAADSIRAKAADWREAA